MRAVPVLAELSALFAGVSGMSFPLYLPVTAPANTGVSIVYCSLGSRSADLRSFLLAFAESPALPSAAMLRDRLARARSPLIGRYSRQHTRISKRKSSHKQSVK
jgi:hypothetical protein